MGHCLHMSHKTIQQTMDYKRSLLNHRFSYYKPHSRLKEDFAAEIAHTLNQKSRSIHPKFFYDKTGSKLFEQICKLPEYYLTRAEIEILNKIKKDLPGIISGDIRLVELGSGSAKKTRLLLDAFSKIQNKLEYFPIDISDIITESSQKLLARYENLHITGIIDTYERGLEFIKEYDDHQNLILFLGSSIGNFLPNDGSVFLEKIHDSMKPNDLFLLGVDLAKDKKILEDAYNDSQGVTAKFNLNLLHRINRELDGNFDTEQFSHHAFYNEEKQRIEIYLKSLEKQIVEIPKANLTVQLEKDELIHTEHSHKYSIPQVKQLMQQIGFDIVSVWQDKAENFAVILSRKALSFHFKQANKQILS